MTDDPSARWSGRAPGRPWVRRGDSDRRSRVRATLEVAGGQGIIMLDDRRIPGAEATIPLIAVAPAGVFVIDSRPHKGLVHTKQPGTLGQLDPPELHVGRTNCTPFLDTLCRQVAIVRATLDGSPGPEVPVTAMLCLTRAEWGFATSARVRGVWVGWPGLMAGALHTPGIIDSPTAHELAGTLDARLPALSTR